MALLVPVTGPAGPGCMPVDIMVTWFNLLAWVLLVTLVVNDFIPFQQHIYTFRQFSALSSQYPPQFRHTLSHSRQ